MKKKLRVQMVLDLDFDFPPTMEEITNLATRGVHSMVNKHFQDPKNGFMLHVREIKDFKIEKEAPRPRLQNIPDSLKRVKIPRMGFKPLTRQKYNLTKPFYEVEV